MIDKMNSAMTAQRALQMLDNETLWEVAQSTHRLLADQGIDYAIVGGAAVFLHGYRRNTVDLDLLIKPHDTAPVRAILENEGFQWSDARNELRSPSGVALHFVIAGEREGPGQETRFPDPSDVKYVTTIEGLPVLSLAELIQSKLACGIGAMRRTHRDFADVVELIAIHRLDKSFARRLHKSVRRQFRLLVDRVAGP
jgi:hypothetical protein